MDELITGGPGDLGREFSKVVENIALRHQLSCLIRQRPRPKLRPADGVFWMLLSLFRNGWRESLVMLKPATVVVWHREGFKFFCAGQAAFPVY